MKSIAAVILFVFITSGCSILGIGDTSESYCDGECNFKKAGVCADAITIYTHRKQLKNRKTKEHWFAEDEDPYYETKHSDSSFTRINEEELGNEE